MLPKDIIIIETIEKHIALYGKNNWYIGITDNNIRKRLFEEHGVNEQNDAWIYRTLESNSLAREIKQHFVLQGLLSDNENDDENGKMIFAYKKISSVTL